MKEMYEGDLYEQQNPTWHEEDAPWKAGHIERMIKRNNLPCQRICEIGCGTGDILLSLGKAFPGADLSGYEISPAAFNRAARKQAGNTKFYLKDLLAEDDLNFDLVLAIDVIEHVEDDRRIVDHQDARAPLVGGRLRRLRREGLPFLPYHRRVRQGPTTTSASGRRSAP